MKDSLPRISYTFLSTYKRCRQRAYWQYVKKVIPLDKINNRPFIVGLAADLLFTKWVGEGYPDGWMEQNAEDIFIWFAKQKNIIYLNPEDKQKLINKLIGSVRSLENCAFDLGFPDKELELQRWLNVSVSGIAYVGKLDIWIPEENLIIDLKVTKQAKYLDDFQLRMFAWLMERTGETVKDLAFLSPLMRPPYREVEHSLSIMVDFEQELFSLVELLKEGRWEVNAKDCWGCPVTKFCEEPMAPSKEVKLPGGGFRFDI